MQIYIKRSKNRTASGVFLLSLILRPHQPSRARKRQKDALFGKKLLKSARKRQKGALLGRKVGKSARNGGKDALGGEKHEKAQEIREPMCTILD